MDRPSYSRTVPGRVFAATSAFALFVAGVMAMTGAGAQGGLLPLIILACVVASIMVVGMSITESPGAALILVLALPPAGGLYFAGLTVVGQMGPIVGVALLALGLVPTWIAIRPNQEAEALSPAHSRA